MGAALQKTSVFLNFPFSKPYEPAFSAFVSGLVALGCAPRSAIETAARGEGRLERIFEILSQAQVSIHDLSCTARSGPSNVPRFNMPFELGLAWAVRAMRKTPRHELVVLERQSFRLQQSLSDFNGHDPEIYQPTPAGVATCLLNNFDSPAKPKHDQLVAVIDRCRKLVALAKKDEQVQPWTAYWFRFLVESATELSVDAGLIDAV